MFVILNVYSSTIRYKSPTNNTYVWSEIKYLTFVPEYLFYSQKEAKKYIENPPNKKYPLLMVEIKDYENIDIDEFKKICFVEIEEYKLLKEII